jgi:hypothetical protein
MATSSFIKNFEVSSRKAVLNLKRGFETKLVKYTPKRDILKEIEEGAKKLKLK